MIIFLVESSYSFRQNILEIINIFLPLFSGIQIKNERYVLTRFSFFGLVVARPAANMFKHTKNENKLTRTEE
jgi:hypothetical protein